MLGAQSGAGGRRIAGPWFTTDVPSAGKVLDTGETKPRVTRYSYDAAGRVTQESLEYTSENGTTTATTTTEHHGDRVKVTPPTGGIVQETVTDARGRMVELRQYTSASSSQTTRYAYDAAGRLITMRDPAGNTWTNTYDLRGRLVSSTDPDRGTVTTRYDDAGQVTSTTDARGQTVWFGYDALGRKTAERAGSESGTLLAQWEYDTRLKGMLTSSTSYHAGSAYTVETTGYDAAYRPLGRSVTLPAVEGSLAGKYTTKYAYLHDGTVKSVTLPAGGGLAEETVSYQYDAAGNAQGLHGGLGWGVYASDARYSPYGELEQMDLGNSLDYQVSFGYERGTRRLISQNVLLERAQMAASKYQDTTFTYDPAGNPTRVVESTAGAKDVQCFGYDKLRRLVQVWTPNTESCAAAPVSGASLGGPAPHWAQFEYDQVGNRTREVRTTESSSLTRTFTYGGGGAGPHALTGVAQSAGVSESYAYDASGNTTSRVKTGVSQSLVWDARGRLTGVSGTGASSFVYSADGERLVRRTGSQVTAYVGEGVEVTSTGSTLGARRFYQFAGRTVAVRGGRLGDDVSVLVGDGQGTGRVVVGQRTDDTDGVAATRFFDPFGAPRGPALGVTWPGDKGFLGKAVDATGLVQVGARYLDASLGRFVSVDPLMDLGDPGQWHGYAYANNNPVTYSDPTGLLPGKMLHDGGGGPRPAPKAEPSPVPVTVIPPVQPASGAGAVAKPSWGTHVWQGYTSWLAGVGNGLLTFPQNTVIDGFNISVAGLALAHGRGSFVSNVVAIKNPNEGAINEGVYLLGNVAPDAATLAIPGAAGVKAPSMAGKAAKFSAKLSQLSRRGATNGVGRTAASSAARVGRGASLENITASEALRIQNAANRISEPISLVGSRASGTAGAYSDWDYVITGINGSIRHSVSSSLPRGATELGVGRQIDIFTGPLDDTLPHITFFPSGG